MPRPVPGRATTPSEFPAARAMRSAGSASTTALIVVALIAVAAAVYVTMGASDGVSGVDASRSVENLGLGKPVANALADRYSDADGDLVADVPVDPAKQRDPETLRFSYLSGEAKNVSPDQLDALRAHLSEATGRPVEYVELPNDKAQLRALAAGELDITGFNTGGVPAAVNVAGFVPCAAPARDGQAATYRMVLLTPSDSELQEPGDIAGRSIAFTRWGSNSGYKAPLVLLRDKFDLLPERDYTWAFSSGHNASIRGIAEGKFEAAATASDLLAVAVSNGDIAESAYRVLYESEAFPVAVLGHAHDLEPGLAEKVAAALLSFDPAGTPVSDVLAGADGIASLNYKDDFALIRRIDDATGVKHELPAPADGAAEEADEVVTY